MLNFKIDSENLGIPDIELAGLKIWIHGRKYPEHYDFWDGNWLKTTILCKTNKSAVWERGDFLRNTEIEDWLLSAEKLNESFLGEANLYPLENLIKIKIKPETYQRISIQVDFYPNDIENSHHFNFWRDRNSLNELIISCHKILLKFPIRGRP